MLIKVKNLFQKFLLGLCHISYIHARLSHQILSHCLGSRNQRLRTKLFHFFLSFLISTQSSLQFLWLQVFPKTESLFTLTTLLQGKQDRSAKNSQIKLQWLHVSQATQNPQYHATQLFFFFLKSSFKCAKKHSHLASKHAERTLRRQQYTTADWPQDTFKISRRRVIRVVTLCSSSELDSLSLPFQS